MALVAAASRASARPGSLVIVDEAENAFTDSFQNRGMETSVDKGWINGFMEKPGNRVIWIVNYPAKIDQTIRRRFGFSLRFPQLGRRERGRLWTGILGRHGLAPESLGGRLDSIVSDHRIPAAVIEGAVAQAVELGGNGGGGGGGGGVDRPGEIGPPGEIGRAGDIDRADDIDRAVNFNPAEDIARAVGSYELLRNGGRMPPAKASRAKDFSVEAVATDADVPALIGRLRGLDASRGSGGLQPGFGTMLFYGPPGTGKTALARHLASALDKEIMVRRASDILRSFVGMSERNVARAFREAEREDAVLVIDEADGFLYSREMAVRSWEATLVNEFLTCLEECRCFAVATSNRREAMDPAAMRRFSFKVPFRYSGPRELELLYLKLLAPLTGTEPDEAFLRRLAGEEGLCPGDFRTVRSRHHAFGGKAASHGDLLDELLLERKLKLEKDARTIGF
jgi:hypothetical protein